MQDTTQLTPEERAARLAKLRTMSDLLLDAIPPDMPHNVLLEALLAVYVVVAEKHPCCTGSAGVSAFYAAQRLEQSVRANYQATVH